MFPVALRSFFALFMPGFIVMLPLFIFISTYILDFEKNSLILIIPFSYALGWLIYEYCYYTKREKFHDIRYQSWEKHIAKIKIKDENSIVNWVNLHHPVDISTCTHLASSLIYHKGGDALIQRYDYYVNTFRMLVCLPFSVLLGLTICLIFCIINLVIYFISEKNPTNSIVIIIFSVFYLVLLFFIVYTNMVLSKQGSQPDKVSRYEKALYQMAFERQDQLVAILARAISVISITNQKHPP